MRSPIAASQGQRSSSVKGMPLAIFFTLAAGCSESPSTKGTPSLSANWLASVVLPEPATPITTISGLSSILRNPGHDNAWPSPAHGLFCAADTIVPVGHCHSENQKNLGEK